MDTALPPPPPGTAWSETFSSGGPDHAGWALTRYDTDPPNIVVWIQDGPGLEYTVFDVPFHTFG